MNTEITINSAEPSQLHSPAKSLSREEKIGRFITFTILLVGAVLMMAPLAFLISSSLKTETQVFQVPFQLIPQKSRG